MAKKQVAVPVDTPRAEKVRRVYNGPPKGSEEAKARMAKVRAAQWAKNGLVSGSDNGSAPPDARPPPGRRSAPVSQ